MNGEKRVNNGKPKLIIQIQDFQRKIEEFKQTSFKNSVEVKPLRSAKNKHQLNTFNFPESKVQVCNTNRKFRKLRKLEEQNVNLMESLEILKESAVSAIAQKEEQIQKLKGRSRYMQDDSIQYYESRLEEEKIARQSIENEREQLYQRLNEQRERFIRDLEQREQNLELLQQYIQDMKRELDQYEQMDQAKTKKLKLLQQQNNLLSEQLQLSSISTALKDRTENIMDLDETIKASHPLSVSSSLPNRSFYSYVDSDHLFQSEIDKSYMTEKLQEIEKSHKQELLDLRSFYEKRISSIREIYERQLRLPTEQSQKQILQTRSRRESRETRSIQYQRSPSRKHIQGLHINLKNMYPIEEGIQNQLETARSNVMNLQNELKMESLSQCPNVEPRFNMNQDNQSQFTTKYFDIPARFMKKNGSTDSLTINNDLQYRLNTKKSLKVEDIKENIIQKSEDQSFVKKSFIFAAGLISGVTLTSLIGYVFTKK